MPNSIQALIAGSTPAATSGGRTLDAMTGEDFLRLLISELSNQDPFQPMSNKEILEQLSAIRSLESNMQMSENFGALLNHQELASATTLIGRSVAGIDVAGEFVTGQVDRIILDASGIRVQVGDHQLVLRNITQVYWEEAPDAA